MTNTELARELRCSETDVMKLLHTLAYRKEYNSRPEVREKRKTYTAERNRKLSMLNNLLKEVK
jgi:hypothetical protein